MTSARDLRKIAGEVAEKLRSEEGVALIEDAIIDAYGGLADYIEAAARAQLAGDAQKVARNLRSANQLGSDQLVLDGMEHASLPYVVIVKDAETGEPKAQSWRVSTFAQIRNEVRRGRQSVEIRDRIVSGQEATIARLEQLGVGDEWIGAEIEASFAPEIDGQTHIELEP